MSGPRRDSSWWGWGDPAEQAHLDDAAMDVLREQVGELEPWERPSSPDEVGLPAAAEIPSAVAEAAGADALFSGDEDRLRHALGKGYADLARVRVGKLDAAPDAVVLPADAAHLGRILGACASAGVAVVPFGGGSSVVGGIEPLRGAHSAVISLDLAQLRGVEVDERSLTATLGAGLRGPEAEAALNKRGLTLGHFPQSFEYATVGGFAATRSAGQASSGYGRFDDMVTSVRLVAPTGTMSTLESPHTAAGPALRELVIGSEGVLGVIPDVTVRVRRSPPEHRYEGWMAESFEAGTEIVRSLAQAGALPDVMRVSDEEETRASLALSGPRGLQGTLFGGYLKARRRAGGALMITGLDGTEESIAPRLTAVRRAMQKGGAIGLGTSVGSAWQRNRYHGPYQRDLLLDRGAMVETLETSHTWSRHGELYRAVGDAIRRALDEQGTPGFVFCHLSHAYADGASLYFTFISRAKKDAPVDQWRAVKTAACEAIVGAGGTITHHHAVGRDHAPYMRAEVGDLGLDVMAAAKERLDPAGVMNPGKLLPA